MTLTPGIIEAKVAEGTVPPRSLPARFVGDNEADASVAAERSFSTEIHRETRELPVYELTIPKGGPKLKLSEDQTPPTLSEPAARPPQPAASILRGAMRMLSGDFEHLPPCRSTITSGSNFANALAGLYLHRSVIDKILFRSVDKLGPIEVDIGVRIFKSIRLLPYRNRFRAAFEAVSLQFNCSRRPVKSSAGQIPV